ncbi:Cu(+)/Ag(+) sensor histidine kinase [Mangrovibacter sp. MFB070]|uniref:Cu(+)/Ag(+) sensor histidine kinase n=1 Tax=Mangrovibacter sp. MFB070 TaxID=1224318 RepID=UPI0005677FE4|nr:Cu(+)/Ag(+) sensor histidine kinase [Mangrovibacter sp. MFB070]
MNINLPGRPFSLALRLTFFISLSTILGFITFTWIMLHSVEDHFAQQDVNDLQQFSARINEILHSPAAQEPQRVKQLQDLIAGYRDISVLIENSHGETLFSSPQGSKLHLAKEDASFLSHLNSDLNSGDVFLWKPEVNSITGNQFPLINNQTYRVIVASGQASFGGKQQSYQLIIGLSINFHLHYLDALKKKLVAIAIVISLVIIFIIHFAVRQGHQPLRKVSNTIKNITSDKLDERLDSSRVPIELEQLVISFNYMIAKIEDVFNRQANFSADIAHEIRTPITNLVTQTEIALSQSRTQKELEDVLYSSLEEYNRMTKMVSDMLFLAQADNHQLLSEMVIFDLSVEVGKVFDFFEAWAEDRNVALLFNGRSCLITGDPLMYRRVLNNLLSNALRYTPEGRVITVSVLEREHNFDLTVENPGAPIPEEHLPRLFDRFYRVDPSRQRKGEGSGIGLAIVKSIVALHHGKIRVESDAVSTRFIISIPRM